MFPFDWREKYNKEFGESDNNGSIMEKQKEDIHCLNESVYMFSSVDDHMYDPINFWKDQKAMENA